MRLRTSQVYFDLVTIILCVAALTKVLDLSSASAPATQVDTVTGLRVKQVVGLSIAVDLGCATLLLSRLWSTYKHLLLLWLGGLFMAYHIVLKLYGVKTGCPCLGSAIQKIALPATVDWVTFGFAGFILAVSGFYFFGYLFREQKKYSIASSSTDKQCLAICIVLLVLSKSNGNTQTTAGVRVEGVATNASFISNNNAPPSLNQAIFSGLFSESGWKIRVKGSNMDNDLTEVGIHEGRIYTLLKTLDQSQITNSKAGVRTVTGKSSTAIIDADAFPHTYWCDWATPIWFGIASGIQKQRAKREENGYLEPLLVAEGNGDLLHNYGFTQKVHLARHNLFPFAPITVAWLHDGISRNWVRREDSWVFPPLEKPLGFPFNKGYTNATMHSTGITNVNGWHLPQFIEYTILARRSPVGYNTNQPVPTKVLQHYSIIITNIQPDNALKDYRPSVNGDYALVKDNRFALSHKVHGVNYFQRGAWKTDGEVLDSMAFLNRKKEMGIVNAGTLKSGRAILPENGKPLIRPLIIAVVTISAIAAVLAVLARARKTQHITNNSAKRSSV